MNRSHTQGHKKRNAVTVIVLSQIPVYNLVRTEVSNRTETPHPVSTANRLWSIECNAVKESRQIGRVTLEGAVALEAGSLAIAG